jgi:hypothetical protein
MNDEELPVNAELASAYLDDELDPVERAAADTDPDVMSMVDSFSRVRAMLGETEDVDAGTRTAAIAAALAEFDARDVPSGAAPVAAAKVMSLQARRMRAYRVLTSVAATLFVGVVAVVALNASRGNDAKSSSASEGTSAAATASDAALPQLKAAADTAAPSADASTTVAAATAGAAPVESATSAGPEIDSRDALKQYAADLQSTQAPPAPGTPSSSSCLTSDQTVLGPIVYQGKAAYAVRNQSTGLVQAIDANDCRVLADVAP